jgi:DNA invertase Pin-like site-specific DNA recombinase
MRRSSPAYISPDVRREAIQRCADYRSIEIVRRAVDEDESGGTQQRPGLRRIMARIAAGETDGIACWRLNRFARNVAGATLERDNLVTGWKTAKSRAVKRGVPIGPTPFGYLRGDDATLLTDPDTAPHVTEAFRIAAKHGHVATLDYLARTAPDKPWTTTTL